MPCRRTEVPFKIQRIDLLLCSEAQVQWGHYPCFWIFIACLLYTSVKGKKTKSLDILLVVNMFLTGFGSKQLSVLYVDKDLKYHDLLQALSLIHISVVLYSTIADRLSLSGCPHRLDSQCCTPDPVSYTHLAISLSLV